MFAKNAQKLQKDYKNFESLAWWSTRRAVTAESAGNRFLLGVYFRTIWGGTLTTKKSIGARIKSLPSKAKKLQKTLLWGIAVAAYSGIAIAVYKAMLYFLWDHGLNSDEAGVRYVINTTLKIVGGTGAAFALYVAWKRVCAMENVRTTERFNSAVDHLGHDNMSVRLGGIYALEHIAQDSNGGPNYHTMIEYLAAFIRIKSAEYEKNEKNTIIKEDVQAAMTVIRKIIKGEQRINLTKSYLRNADLKDANLEGVDLRDAEFENTNLKDTILDGTNLKGAKLQKAQNLTPQQLLSATSLFQAEIANLHKEQAEQEDGNLWYLLREFPDETNQTKIKDYRIQAAKNRN